MLGQPLALGTAWGESGHWALFSILAHEIVHLLHKLLRREGGKKQKKNSCLIFKEFFCNLHAAFYVTTADQSQLANLGV